MKYFIKERHYYLIDFDRGYTRYIFTGKNQKLHRTAIHFTQNQIKEVCRVVKPLFEKRILNSKPMFDFWKHADNEIKTCLLFSYWVHADQRQKKVANVEIRLNWLEDSYFGSHYHKIKTHKNLINYFRTIGKHDMGLRFDNIHLTVDLIGEKKVYGVHWDNQNSAKPLGWLSHLLFDDIGS